MGKAKRKARAKKPPRRLTQAQKEISASDFKDIVLRGVIVTKITDDKLLEPHHQLPHDCPTRPLLPLPSATHLGLQVVQLARHVALQFEVDLSLLEPMGSRAGC